MKYLRKIKSFYDKNTSIYIEQTGGYIHGYATPEGFLSNFLNENFIKGSKVILDAGCGIGKLSTEIASINNEVNINALTISEKQYCIGKKLIHENNIQDRVHIELGDFHQLSKIYPENYFDRIIFNESLLHSKNIDLVLSETYKVLKKGGMVYSKDIYQNATCNLIEFLDYKKVVRKINRNYHYYPINTRKMEKKCKSANFEIISFIQPAYKSDFLVMVEFEKRAKLNTYKFIEKINATHWRELLLKKN